MLALPITGVLCCFSRDIVVESADHFAGLKGNFPSKTLSEKKESEALGETTVLQTRVHPSQKLFNRLGTLKLHPPLAHCHHPMLFVRSSWTTTERVG